MAIFKTFGLPSAIISRVNIGCIVDWIGCMRIVLLFLSCSKIVMLLSKLFQLLSLIIHLFILVVG